MANPSPDVVQAAVDKCNEAMHSIDTDIGELDIIDELQGYADKLAEVWQTENGEYSIAGLNRSIKALKTQVENLKRAMENIKNDTYTFEQVEYFKGSGRL